eukprot:1792903-Amphidinium_carterae.3
MARYTVCSFERHQARFICRNAFESGLEPNLTKGLSPPTLDLAKFIELLSPCFPANSNIEDVGAVLKRTNVVVFGNYQVLLRLADSKGLDGPAKVIHHVDGVKDLISPEAKPNFGEYKRGASWD